MKSNPSFHLIVIIVIFLLFILTACANASPATPQATQADLKVTNEVSVEATTEIAVVESAEDEGEQIVITPTPAPTATPSVIDDLVSDFATTTGVNQAYLFGLSGEDWINLIISALFVIAGVIISNRVLIRILVRITRKTKTVWDEDFLGVIDAQIRWLVIVFFLQYATTRLAFLSPDLKQWLEILYFILYVYIAANILWKLIDFAGDYYRTQIVKQDESHKPEVVITLIQRVARATVLIIAIIVVLSRFGVNVNALVAALGIGGLALSLAAQDTLADAINGFIILVDQPFRVGDRIEIQSLDTWGDVVEIGTRTTRIRTRDNRMVIIPNSTIGKSQIVNYTYPDPRYRIQMEVGIAYGTDIEYVRQLIINTVRKVDGVLRDKPVDALFNEMGDSAMTFRIRWWIESYEDTRRIYDRVNTALQNMFDAQGINLPNITYDVNVMYKNEVGGRDTPRLAGDKDPETGSNY